MKKSKNLLILFLAVLILLAFYLFIKNRPQEESRSNKTSVKDTIITTLDSSKIRKIVLKSNNNILHFQKNEQLWTGNFTFPYKQDKIVELTEVFSNLRAEQIIDENPVDLEQYGLNDPKMSIEVTVENDKNPKIMFLGDLTPTGNSYYFCLKENPTVYTIPKYNGAKFTQTPSDFRDYSLSKINIQEINYLKLSRSGNIALEIKQNPITSKLTDYGIGIWEMTKPYQEPKLVATEKFQSIIESFVSIMNAEEFIEDNPTDLNRYGLENPQSEILIKDKQSHFHLLIGKPMDNEFVYCKKSDSNTIFTIKRSNLSIIATKPFDLIDKFVFIVNIEDVDRISVSGLGVNHTLNINRKRNPSPKSDSDKFLVSYEIDAKIVDEQLFKTIYQSLIGLLLESECHGQTKSTVPDLKLSYKLNKGTKQQIDISFIPFNDDFYAVSQNGKSEFLISKNQVEVMVQELMSLVEE